MFGGLCSVHDSPINDGIERKKKPSIKSNIPEKSQSLQSVQILEDILLL